jgi:hypothetical protein
MVGINHILSFDTTTYYHIENKKVGGGDKASKKISLAT